MTRPSSVGIVMPALNEEENLAAAFNSVMEANKKYNYDLNILIVNDGSSDSTGSIADDIAQKYSFVKVHHNKYTRGLGAAYILGMIKCTGEYFGYIPGDNQIQANYISELFERLGEADLVLSYPANMEVRHKHRQVVSRLFTRIYNFLFRLNLQYYNGPAFFRLSLLREMDFPTRFFSYHAETVIRFIKHGYSYIQVPCILAERQYGKSTALKWYNFLGISLGTLLVFMDFYVLRRSWLKKIATKRKDIDSAGH